MMKMILMTSSFLNSALFVLMKHPLSMGIILLIQTLMICLISSLSAKNFWFSYVLFLIFLGGMLILFIYVISLASNEMFNFSFNLFMKMILMFFFICLVILFLDKFYFQQPLMMMESLKTENLNFLNIENNLLFNKLYNFPTNMITILLMIYLFLCLIAVCKIINIYEGPLRPKY
uniref:NADH dehydrogenase subunit 6 n=1 Tax=Thienemanniella majuscula TaxID=611686 RepID=UPI0028D0050C|nr:NADH dehydrogenase subunit 6 [Thienemanniella majuscula]WML69327.1 NADH dehydrogenase subunit 6 [Thienemanniella majuscula]